MHMRISGQMRAAPHSVGDRPLCNDPEAGRKRFGDDVIYRLLVGNVDTQLDRLEQSAPYGRERRIPIAAIADIADLAGLLRALERPDDLAPLEQLRGAGMQLHQ